MLISEHLDIAWPPISVSGWPAITRYNFPVAVPHTRIGIEVEAEGFTGFNLPSYALQNEIESVWMHKPEGSLRDRGIEFVTHPIQGAEISHALSLLETMNVTGKLYYTDLAGLHIHLNVREFTIQQLLNLIVLYMVFEDSLYRVSGNREQSIYCLPARTCWSGLPNLFRTQNLLHSLGRANKYMGFNYCTIPTLGTVEFRHSRGTKDVSYILHWINTLLRMHHYAERANHEQLKTTVFDLNTNSSYTMFANDVFGPDVDWIDCSNLAAEMSEGVSILKEWTMESHMNSSKIMDSQKKKKTSRVKIPKLADNHPFDQWFVRADVPKLVVDHGHPQLMIIDDLVPAVPKRRLP